ncbi:hypothetical protein KKF84_12745 [Myxococcota bacterium]|nr:hypothetical protein [Myxococcota bacterium]
MRRRRHRALKICYILKSSAVTWKLCRQFTDNDTRRACVLKGPYYKPCWGTHLTSVTRERMKKPKPLPVRVVKVVKQKPAVAPKPRPVVKNPTPVVKRIPEPTGPPPQPLKDKRPPKPSLNAAWVHGFYKWNGAAWYWFHGFWRVPQKDILARKTQKAPKLPPPPRVELTTPPPYPGAVYTKGYWMWSGGRFIWIPGRWALPRGLQYRWQPPRWQRTPHGIYFVPGGWVPR